ncbi:MAG: hypothetical protein FWC40_10250 [Proteobacteria bacterium]|nr:hypothetical protein [Pseudomonadota bacterium]
MLRLARDWAQSPAFDAILQRHAPETGYTYPMLRFGFDRMFSHWHIEAWKALIEQQAPALCREALLERWLDADIGTEQRAAWLDKPSRRLFLVTASTVPSASLQDAILPLILPFTVTVRPAHNLVALFEALRDDICRVAPILGARLSVSRCGRDDDALQAALREHDMVSVSGSDTTIAHYKSRCEALGMGMIAHGHKLSAIALTAGDFLDLDTQDYANIACDASVWDQTGCLSPKCLFIDASPDEAGAFAKKLCHHLDAIAAQLPEMPPNMQELSLRNTAIQMAVFDGASLYRGKVNHDLIILHPPHVPFEPVLIPRCLNIYLTPDPIASSTQLAPYGQALGTKKPLTDNQKTALSKSGYNYFPRLGAMQDPPLTWCHDGIGSLAPLLDQYP